MKKIISAVIIYSAALLIITFLLSRNSSKIEILYTQSMQNNLTLLSERAGWIAAETLIENTFLSYSIRLLDADEEKIKVIDSYLSAMTRDNLLYGFAFMDNRMSIIYPEEGDSRGLLSAAALYFKSAIENLQTGNVYVSDLVIIDNIYYMAAIHRLDNSTLVMALTSPQYFSSFINIKKEGKQLFYLIIITFSVFTLLLGVVVSILFMAERKRSQHEARRQRLEEIGTMTSEIAHSLKNPVQIIDLSAENIEDRDTAVSIHEECGRLITMINSFLDLTKEREVAYSRFSSAELKRRLESSALSFKDIQFSFASGREYFNSDIDLLVEIIENLFSNSSRYKTGEISCVSVVIGKQGRKSIIHYTDDGKGIPPELHEKVFKPFFTTSEKGTGLGLARIKRNLEYIQAGIRLRKSETGAAFEITLPG
jgi:signal transduction histidine kinase